MQREREEDRLPSLPPELQMAAREIRAMRPSEGFEGRLRSALADIDRGLRTGHAKDRRPRSGWWKAVATLVPAGAAALVSLEVGLRDEIEYHHRFEEMYLNLPEKGEGWLHLDLQTHRHEGSPAKLMVHAPRSIRVLPVEKVTYAFGPPQCKEGFCTHWLTEAPVKLRPVPIRLGVRGPGSYHIRVEHTSKEAHVREEFVVHATE